MSKAERYIELVSDENGYLYDQHALRAVEIAREEMIEWLEKNIYMYNGECEGDRKAIINDLKQAMKDG